MSVAAHLKQLEEKKHSLEAQIHEESARPSPNYTVIRDLKKKKLLVKEKIYKTSRTREEMWATA